jgi:hypothetical protein
MPLPTAWTKVRVFGTYLRTDGTANQGSVWFELDQRVVIHNDTGTVVGVLPKRQIAPLDKNGYFEIELPCTDDPAISPTGWTYQVSEKFNGGERAPYSIEVPTSLASEGINLVEYPHATPVPVNPPVVTYLRVQDIGVTVASQTDMNNAIAIANSASSQAAAAVSTANTAAADAANALSVANGIDAKATTALANSNTAIATANDAKTTADGIDAKATTALANSEDAVDTANQALAALGPIGTGGTAGAMLVGNGNAVPPVYKMFKSPLAGAIDMTWQAKAQLRVEVENLGAVGDGVADDTAAIDAIASALSSAGGGTLVFAAKTYLVSSLKLYTGVIYQGSARTMGDPAHSTTIKLKNGTNPVGLVTKGSNKSSGWQLRDLLFDVNKANNTSGHGIYLYAVNDGVPLSGDTIEDGLIQNVVVRNAKGNGLHISGDLGGYNIVRVHIDRFIARNSDGLGIYAQSVTDSVWDGIELSGCRLGAAYLTSFNNMQLHYLKGYYNGQDMAAGANSFSVTITNSARGTWNVETQEEWRSGIAVTNCSSFVGNFLADANGYPGTTAQIGVMLSDVQYCDVDVTSDSYHYADATPFLQNNPLKFQSTTANVVGVNCRVQFQHQTLTAIQTAFGTSVDSLVLTVNGATQLWSNSQQQLLTTHSADGNRRMQARSFVNADATPGDNLQIDLLGDVLGSKWLDLFRNTNTASIQKGLRIFRGDNTGNTVHQLFGGTNAHALLCQSGGGWNTGNLGVGASRFWIDSTGVPRYKTSAPTADQDGTALFTGAFKNKIINGNFDWWQRGTSRAAGVGQFYIADRWRDNSNGTTVASSQQAFALGQTAVPGEPAFFHRSVVASVAGAGNFAVLQQVIESVRTLAGRNAVLTFYAKADAAKNMAVEMSQTFGTGGSPSAAVNFGITTLALTTNWVKQSIPLAVPSITGKTLGTNNNDGLQVGFWFDAGSNFNADTNTLGQQSGTFDIARVQIEEGTTATAFEDRPIETELALCQRYCFATGNIPFGGAFALGHQINATSAIAMFNTPVTMRAQPTMTITGTIGWTGDGTANTVNPSLAVGYNNQMLLLFGITGATAGRAGYCAANTAGSNPAAIVLSAEY